MKFILIAFLTLMPQSNIFKGEKITEKKTIYNFFFPLSAHLMSIFIMSIKNPIFQFSDSLSDH